MPRSTLLSVIQDVERLLPEQKKDRERISRALMARRAYMVDVATHPKTGAMHKVPAKVALEAIDSLKRDFNLFETGMRMVVTWQRGLLSDAMLKEFDRITKLPSPTLAHKIQAVMVAGLAYNHVFVITRYAVFTRELAVVCRHGANADTAARMRALGEAAAGLGADALAQWSHTDLMLELGRLIAAVGSASAAPIGGMVKSAEWFAQYDHLAAAALEWRRAVAPLLHAAVDRMVTTMRAANG
jgi:hypothetical protein